MRKTIVLVSLLCLTASPFSAGLADVIVSPASIGMAQGQAGSATLQYQFSNVRTAVGGPFTGVVTSTNGAFLAGGGGIIATNAAPLSVNITNGAGIAGEALALPVAVIERALKSGVNTIQYRRIFATPLGDTAVMQINITSDAAASFNVKRIELYFANHRAEATVPRHSPNLKAYADIRYDGSGLLEGYWEVDGRIVARVNQMLTFGATVTLQTPDVPALPTFAPGTHVVRFVTLNKAAGLPTPALVYFVTPEEYPGKRVEIGLKAPGDGAAIERGSALFQWGAFPGASLYVIEYYENREANPIFSAYTNGTSYTLPRQTFTNLFLSPRSYYWKVTGYNDRENAVGQSALKSFTVKE